MVYLLIFYQVHFPYFMYWTTDTICFKDVFLFLAGTSWRKYRCRNKTLLFWGLVLISVLSLELWKFRKETLKGVFNFSLIHLPLYSRKYGVRILMLPLEDYCKDWKILCMHSSHHCACLIVGHCKRDLTSHHDFP